MSIIPIDKNAKLVHKEGEAEFYFKYLLGRDSAKLSEINDILGVPAQKHIEEAKKLIEKDPEVELTDSNVAKVAIILARQAGDITPAMELEYSARLVDLFTIGWKGSGFPTIGKNSKPSEYLSKRSIEELCNIISGYVEELVGLSVEDKKK